MSPSQSLAGKPGSSMAVRGANTEEVYPQLIRFIGYF